jgi:hypothetical protein
MDFHFVYHIHLCGVAFSQNRRREQIPFRGYYLKSWIARPSSPTRPKPDAAFSQTDVGGFSECVESPSPQLMRADLGCERTTRHLFGGDDTPIPSVNPTAGCGNSSIARSHHGQFDHSITKERKNPSHETRRECHTRCQNG